MSSHPAREIIIAHETEWLRMSHQAQLAFERLAGQSNTLMHAAGFRKETYRGSTSWRLYRGNNEPVDFVNLEDAKAVLVSVGDGYVTSYSRTGTELLAQWDAARDAATAANGAVTAHEANYTGWNRFYLVTSSTGHIHSSTRCSSCNKGTYATQFAMLPELSGTDIETAVTALGAVLCSRCFPEAPVEWQDAEKIPARIATLLLSSGPEAFNAELAKYRVKKAAAGPAKRYKYVVDARGWKRRVEIKEQS